METTSKQEEYMSQLKWLDANRYFLEDVLEYLRLILQRRVFWLRQKWKHDPLQYFQGQVISDAQADWLLAGEDRAAERRYYGEDSNTKEITQAIGKAQRKLEEHSESLLGTGMPAALDALTQIFGLTAFDREILLLCLAPELDPTFERLYAYVQDDVTRKYVSPHLSLSLFTIDRDSQSFSRHSFLPEAPLFKFHLIHREDPAHTRYSWTSSPLWIDPRIADYLQGINRLDEKVSHILDPVSKVGWLPQSYDGIVDKLRRFIKTDDGRTSPLILNFTGSSITGKSDVASRLCASLGIQLYRLNAKRLHSSGMQWHDIAPVLERECMLIPAVLFIDATQLDSNSEPSNLLLETLIEKLSIFFIVGSRETWTSEREMLVVPVPTLNAEEQSTLWKQQLEIHGDWRDGQIESVVEQFDFESDAIVRTIASAKAKARMQNENRPNLTFDDIWLACREQSQNGLNGLAQRIDPCYTWEDIVLPGETLEQLKDIAAQVTHRALVYEDWGFGAKLSRGRGISALFSGPSGTGKTMAAEILANHLKLDLFRIDLSAVVNKYIGETEKNLRRVFDAAEQSGAILFFDEADALFGKRSEVKDSHDRYANIEINYLLQRMEDYRGLAILATNMKSLLDQAFSRRLRFHVEFPLPDVARRQRIWQKSFPAEAALGSLDFRFLSQLEIPGGNIKNIVLNAAFISADDGQIIEMSHILRATKREYIKINKMILESEFGPHYEAISQ